MATNKTIKLGKWTVSEEELLREFADARKAGEESLKYEPHAKHVYFDETMKRVVIEMTDDIVLAIPYKKIQGLQNSNLKQLQDVRVMGAGSSIRWEQLDVDMGVVELCQGLFGTKSWMRELAAKGGKVKSEAKTTSSRANGMKGGRPRKNESPVFYSNLVPVPALKGISQGILETYFHDRMSDMTLAMPEIDSSEEIAASDFILAEEKLANLSSLGGNHQNTLNVIMTRMPPTACWNPVASFKHSGSISSFELDEVCFS